VPIDLVIFDCDGVLVDSEVISCRAHATVLTRRAPMRLLAICVNYPRSLPGMTASSLDFRSFSLYLSR
jgi:phosphoglycolate phosphatase-like HAD superfamily hydrolase